METLDLTTPVQPPSTTTYRVTVLHLDWPNGVINITLVDNNGVAMTVNYTNAEATTLMQFLNTANLSVKSLHKRILEKLVADGKLTGTISGTP